MIKVIHSLAEGKFVIVTRLQPRKPGWGGGGVEVPPPPLPPWDGNLGCGYRRTGLVMLTDPQRLFEAAVLSARHCWVSNLLFYTPFIISF